jgi:four helix bundle protein
VARLAENPSETQQIKGVPMADYVFPFEKLDVWQLAVDLAEFVLGLLEHIPRNKHIRLVSQMEAAATSPAQNIAEGKGRQYKKEFIQFLHIAQGSVYEVVTLNEVLEGKDFLMKRRATKLGSVANKLIENSMAS